MPSRRLLFACIVALSLMSTSVVAQMQRFPLSGGSDGSTAQHFGAGLATLLTRALEGVQVTYTASAGSQENLGRLASDSPGFAIVLGGDLYRSSLGTEEQSAVTAPAALVLSHLYGITAHLLVSHDQPIHTIDDLVGRRVALGQAGSAAANAARHYFEATALWGRFEPQFMSPAQGAAALAAGETDALWLFEEMPSTVLIQLATQRDIRLIALAGTPQFTQLEHAHPYYTRTVIESGFYPGVSDPVSTFAEAALWVVSPTVPDEIVTDALTTLYSEAGLAFMHTVSETARELQPQYGLRGVVTPLHPGAERFWR